MLGFVEKLWWHDNVMGQWVVLGDIVNQVVFSGGPENDEVALACAVLYPMEPHVDGLGMTVFDFVIGKSHCCLVVDHEWRRRLWMAHLLEGNTHGTRFFRGAKGGSDFGFHG